LVGGKGQVGLAYNIWLTFQVSTLLALGLPLVGMRWNTLGYKKNLSNFLATN